MKRSALASAAFVGGVLGQASLYGQCGGNGWSGPTSCASGSHCEYQNEWYSQCLPGAGDSTPTTTSSGSTTTSSAPGDGGSGSTGDGQFATTSGTLFTLDGETSYFAGTNCYWCGFLTTDGDIDIALDDIQEAGLKILRVWGFNDVATAPSEQQQYFQYLSASGSTINTGRYGLQLLDKVVEGAESRGIKLIINFVNNWDDYGGIKAYTTAFGGDHQGWFTNEAAQAQYRKYIAAVVGRYMGSDAVLAWELANEPRCQGCDTDVIYQWASDTSAYVKSLDPDHLVTLGDEGFGLPGDGSYPYTYYEGVDWEKNLGIETLDFGTFHLYPDSWGVSYDWAHGWIEAHASLCQQAGKPCFFEEYGVTSNQCAVEKPWQQTSLSLAGEGMAADAFWQFGTQLTYSQSADDGNTLYVGTDEWTCLVTDHVASI